MRALYASRKTEAVHIFGDQATKLLIERRAGQVCQAVRDALTGTGGVKDFYNWVTAQLDGDLTTLGFTASDITFLRSAAADLHGLAVIYGGGASPITLPYDFTVNSKQVIGPL